MWLVGWLVGWLAGWLAGWLSVDQSVGRCPVVNGWMMRGSVDGWMHGYGWMDGWVWMDGWMGMLEHVYRFICLPAGLTSNLNTSLCPQDVLCVGY